MNYTVTKISALPSFVTTPTSGFVPISINGITYKVPLSLILAAINPNPTTDYFTVAAAGTSATFAGLVGKTIAGPILRGGIGTGQLILTGTPTGNQIKFDTSTGTLSVHADNALFAGEELTISFV